MSKIFARQERRGGRFPDDDIEKIRDLLVKMGKMLWSARPRTYAVLRMMGKEAELLDQFVEKDLLDIQFPYSALSLPLIVRSPSDRRKFLEKQAFILTDANLMETGSHAHLATDANTHFEINCLLGRGGFGAVEEVTSNLSYDTYARKTILRNKTFGGSESQERSFRNELQNLKRLNHHHLVKYIGSYTDPLYFGILLLPIADMNLQQYLEQSQIKTNELQCIRQFFGCITCAVAYLHRNSCRHKDIKPGNILIKRGAVYITDFGLAYDWTDVSKSRTKGEAGAMSFNYVSPEVVAEEERGSSSDMWSLGCIFLDMITVLNGQTLEDKKNFFRNTGTGGSTPRNNEEAYTLWMDQLKSSRDTLPWSWTKEVIVMTPGERLTSYELLQKIRRCVDPDDGFMYYCLRCDESNEGPTAIPDIPQRLHVPAEEKDDVDENSTTLPSIQDGLRRAVTRGDQSDTRLWLKRWANLHFKTEDCEQSLGAPTTGLHIAARQGYREIAADLLKYGFDVNAKTMGSAPIHIAVASGHEAVLRLLVGQRADVNVTDGAGVTPLHIAAGGFESMVSFLLEHGAKVNALEKSNATPLLGAAYSGNERVVSLLLQQPNIDTTICNSAGLNALHVSALNGHAGTVSILLEHGVDVDCPEAKVGNSPLHFAAAQGHRDVVEVLMRKRAQVNPCQHSSPNASPLHLAVSNKHTDVTQLLLGGGVNPGVTDFRGQTALHLSVAEGNIEIALLLIDHGFDINAPVSNPPKLTPLMIAVETKDVPMVELLLRNGANIDAASEQGATCLHYLVMQGDLRLLTLFLEYNPNLEVQNKGRYTPLMGAAAGANPEIVKKLVEKGASVLARSLQYETPLHLAVMGESEDVVKILLENNADANAQDRGQSTPLHTAVLKGNMAIAKLLLKAGAKIDVEDMGKHSPLSLAVKSGHTEMKNLLKAHQEMAMVGQHPQQEDIWVDKSLQTRQTI